MLFRDEVAPERVWPRWRVIVLTFVAAAALLGLALATSESQRIALYFCLSIAGIFAVFIALGYGITALARRLPRPRQAGAGPGAGQHRCARRPDALRRAVARHGAVAAGRRGAGQYVHRLGALHRLPKNSPDYFILDIPQAELSSLIGSHRSRDARGPHQPGPDAARPPGQLGDRPVEQIKAPPEAAWVLTGDRGLTYSDEVPEGSTLAEGTWWPADYTGEPLVSFEAELAKGLGVKIGDRVTVNVLGRNLTARIANLRDVKWESLAINFVMVFSPNTLRGAPHNLLATVTLPNNVSAGGRSQPGQEHRQAHPGRHDAPRQGCHQRLQFHLCPHHDRCAGGGQRHAGGRRPGAWPARWRRRSAGASGRPSSSRRSAPRGAHPARALSGIPDAGRSAFSPLLLGGLAAWIAVTQVMELPSSSPGAAAEALLLARLWLPCWAGSAPRASCGAAGSLSAGRIIDRYLRSRRLRPH